MSYADRRPLRITQRIIMRTLLRHSLTHQYFQSLETWTPDRNEAHDFGLIARAVKFAHKAGLSDLDLILSFESHEQASAVSFERFRLGSSPATRRGTAKARHSG